MSAVARAAAGLVLLTGLTGCPKKNKPPPVVRLFMGPHVTCAELVSGELRCQGRGADGQLGPGAAPPGPHALPVAAKVVDVRFSERATCVVSPSTSQCFGVGEGEVQVTPAACYLREGRVICDAARFPSAPKLDGLSGVAEVASGRAHACARLETGTIVCWGDNGAGQLAAPRPASSDVPVPIQGIFGAAQIVAAGDGTCVRHTDKTVRCWGRNDDGRLSPGHGDTLNVPAPVHF